MPLMDPGRPFRNEPKGFDSCQSEGVILSRWQKEPRGQGDTARLLILQVSRLNHGVSL